MAAVMAGGEGAALSHRSAGNLLAIRIAADAVIDVTVADALKGRDGIVWHANRIEPDEITDVDGIPVTTVSRTLLDLAAVRPPREVERALEEAHFLKLTDPVGLPGLLERYPGRRGAGVVRRILEAGRIGTTRTRSPLEERFLAFLERYDLPIPEFNAAIAVGGRFPVVDCVWRGARLVAELDGRDAHGTPEAFEDDRIRDQEMLDAGWSVIRITSWQLRSQPAVLAARLNRLLGLLPAQRRNRT